MTNTAIPPAHPRFGEALVYWLKLGFVSFGGPAGQIAIMHAELVERRRWISERRFLHALNYCMLLPGPEAQQLAIYLGWLLHRTWGGIMAGVMFVLPSLFILVGLSWVYLAYGHVPAIAGAFYGIKPAVTALVVHAAYRLGSRSLKNYWRRFLPSLTCSCPSPLSCWPLAASATSVAALPPQSSPQAAAMAQPPSLWAPH
jgi:chromate transporter